MERILRHVLYWLSWLMFFAIINSSYNEDNFLMWVKIELVMMTSKIPLTYFIVYVLLPKFLEPKKYFSFFSLLFVAAVLGGIFNWSLWYYYAVPVHFDYSYESFWQTKIVYKSLDLVYTASLPTMYKLWQRQVNQESEYYQLMRQNLKAELKVLKNQLQPHFLFNTLNNLYGMVLSNHPQAADVVIRLSEMMNYMLYDGERPRIELEKEIANMNNYIELEKIRYGKRLDISFETAGEINGKTIPPLLFLPFIENAFKHGVGDDENNPWVRINLWVQNDDLTFMVENSIPKENENPLILNAQRGIGLNNVKKRLQLIYGDNHELEINDDETYLVKMKIHLSTFKAIPK